MSCIFISHSSQDYEIALKLTNFFRLIFNGDEEFVFCSSVNSIGAAEDSEEVILHSIQSSQFNMFIITEHFLASPFCMCELGAGWVQNKKPYIFLAGIERSDERLLQLPKSLMAAQNIVVREGDARSIKFWLRNVISQIGTFIAVELEESDYLTDMSKLVEYLSESPHTNTKISMLNSSCFHHPDCIPRQAMEIVEATLKSVTVSVNHCEFKPQYTGLAIKLYNSSWTKAFDQGKVLSFEIAGNKEIPCIVMELKGKNKETIFDKELPISELTKKFSFGLAAIDVPRNEFENMTELVFVLNSNTAENRGIIQIKNVCLK